MGDRGQFTFYASFAEAISRIKKKTDRADAYDAVVRYALYNVDPDMDKLPDAAAVVFMMAKPHLDAARRKSDGGRRRDAAKKPEDAEKIP